MAHVTLSLDPVTDFDNLCDIYDLTHAEASINLRVELQDVIMAERLLTRKHTTKRLRDYLGDFDDVI